MTTHPKHGASTGFLLGQLAAHCQQHNPSFTDAILARVRDEDWPGVQRGLDTPPDAPMRHTTVVVPVTDLRGA
jgi:hypothetical protein